MRTEKLMMAALCGVASAFAGIDIAPIDASADRVKTPLKVDMERIGTIRPRPVSEIRDSNWTLGCETVERGYADFWQYADYIAPLGIKTIRIQTGWARCEPEKGRFDFEWLDKIVDFARSKGVNVLLETSYGNPIYPGAGGWDLGAGFPTSEEGLAAWDRWIETLATHYKGRVRDWAMWNEPDIRNPALPGHEVAKTPQDIAVFNVRTAKIIRKVIPDSRIAGLSLATVRAEFFEDCLKTMGEDVRLFDWFIYHGYAVAPESSYDSVEKLKAVLKKYHPAAKMRQGENGCPSELATRFAMSGVAWSEYSQAKWDMRRMLGDLGHDVESSVFTICDFNHVGREINRKGLLRANAGKKVLAVKRAYYAVQNVVSVFDSNVTRIAEPAITNVDISVAYYEYRNRSGLPIYAFWSCGRPERQNSSANPRERRYVTVYLRPEDSFETRPTVFTVKGQPMKDPVWVDLLTGRIYAYPKGNMREVDGETFYIDVPVYDSPCLLTERAALDLMD
jgi:hypothetical protein